MIVPLQKNLAMIIMGGLFIQMVVLALWMVKPLLDDEYTSCFGPVVTTETHLAFSGAGTHFNNTAEMTAMTEAFSFLGLRGTVAFFFFS